MKSPDKPPFCARNGEHRCRIDLSGHTVPTKTFRNYLDRNISASSPCSIRRIEDVAKMPSCGNGVCEIGEPVGINEQQECSEDCSFPFIQCRTGSENNVIDNPGSPCSGHGIFAVSVASYRDLFPLGLCLFADGICECFEGYRGPACDQCAPGYYDFKGLCYPRQLAYRPAQRDDAEENDVSVNQPDEEISNVHTSSTYVRALDT